MPPKAASSISFAKTCTVAGQHTFWRRGTWVLQRVVRCFGEDVIHGLEVLWIELFRLLHNPAAPVLGRKTGQAESSEELTRQRAYASSCKPRFVKEEIQIVAEKAERSYCFIADKEGERMRRLLLPQSTTVPQSCLSCFVVVE